MDSPLGKAEFLGPPNGNSAVLPIGPNGNSDFLPTTNLFLLFLQKVLESFNLLLLIDFAKIPGSFGEILMFFDEIELHLIPFMP